MSTNLEELAYCVRRNVLEMAEYGGCFVGSAFSCVEIITYLYERVLSFNPAAPDDPARDILLLSKGHAVPALYGYFVENGLLARDRLALHQSGKDVIYLHPNAELPGVEMHSGSLGHGLAIALGMALHFKSTYKPNRVFVILGDGELNEGSNWEALLIAASCGVDNLFLVVDRNGFQANARTEALVPLEPLADKFRAFGCHVAEGNGHDYADLERLFAGRDTPPGRPRVILARTVRGRGLPSFENDWEAWFVTVTPTEKAALLGALQRVRG